MAQVLTATELRRMLKYDEQTGVFTWLEPAARQVKAGSVAGGLGTDGYWRIAVCGRRYKAHRLAWFYVNGRWPSNDIDHIDGDRLNNRFDNLRDVTRAINLHNIRQPRTDSATKVQGVQPSLGKFQARIRIAGRKIYLGTFDTPEDASAAYQAEKRRARGG